MKGIQSEYFHLIGMQYHHAEYAKIILLLLDLKKRDIK